MLIGKVFNRIMELQRTYPKMTITRIIHAALQMHPEFSNKDALEMTDQELLEALEDYDDLAGILVRAGDKTQRWLG